MMDVINSTSPTIITPTENSNTNNNNNNNNSMIETKSPRFNSDQELKKINLSNQKIFRIDEFILEFQNQYKLIRELNLDNNLLGEIPSILKELKQLDSLSLSNNYIMEIPKWVSSEFSVLRKLNLSHNTIQKLPDSFSQMNFLEDLDLSFNIIGYIPPSHFPHNLVSLNLSHNQLQEIELPPWHENLYELDLSCNKLKYLGQIPYHLTKMHLDDNRLLSIDHKVIQRYRDLRLKFNKSFSDVVLERIYQCWYSCDPVLDLSGIGLSTLPPVIGLLTHLTTLDISGNCLSVLPPELETLTNLQRLDLSYNIITTLPLYLLNFKNLKFLGLQGTLDTLVSPPKKIAEGGIQEIVRYFQDLFVGDPSFRVKLMIVGQENVGKTSLVKCLKMKKKFGKGFDHLGSNVSTDGIDIDEIKFSLSIDSVNYNNNNNTYLNNLVINSTSSNIVHQQQTIIPQQQLLNPNVNSSLTTNTNTTNTNSTGTNSGSNSGNAHHTNNNNTLNVTTNSNDVNSTGSTPTSSGNTTSGSKEGGILSQPPQAPPPPPIPTINTGITTHLSNTSTTNNNNNNNAQTIQKITISIWDCAGQELYYTSHQMFLTDSALYTVVWDLCKPEVNSRVEFWLHSVRSKAETAPIILIGTHLDSFLESHSEQELDDILATVYTKYFRKFRLKGICVVSCSTGSGFDNFQDLLKRVISELPSIKQPLPELYTKLEKLIIKRRANLVPPILSWSNFAQFVLSNLPFHDEVHVKVATKALVSLGILSYFDEPVLENYVFLDPQWLTSVFASIITTKHKFIKDGILKRSDLYQIWKPPNYLDDEVLHGLLISLLERFELMFPLDGMVQSHYSTSQISSMNLKASNHVGSNGGSSDSMNGSMNNGSINSGLGGSTGIPSTTVTSPGGSSVVLASSSSSSSSLTSTTSMASTSGSSLTISHRAKSPQISNRSINGKNSIFGTTKQKKNTSSSTLSILASSTTSSLGLNNSNNIGGRGRSNSDSDSLVMMSPTMTSSSHNIESIPEQQALNSVQSIDFNQKFMIPTQLPEKRPSFELLWPHSDPSRIEYNRWFQLTFVPSGLFSRLLIRFMTSREFDIKPILYWRNGVIVESSSGRGYLSTSTALIEMVSNSSTGITTLMISVRGNRRTGKSITAKLLRLIVEITDTLCTSWYHLELTQAVPCPHCVLKSSKLTQQNTRVNLQNCTLFTLEKCEMAASNGEWFLQCGNRKIGLESFVPDVAMSDFWGTGSKKFNYDQIQLHKEKRLFRVKPSEFVGAGFCEVKVVNPMISPILSASNSSTPSLSTLEKSPTNDIPVVCHVKTIAKDSPASDDIPILVYIDQKTQTIQITGTIRHQSKEVEIEFLLPKLIGRGASGKIYRAELSGTMVAVKQLEVQGEEAPRIFSEFRKEIHVMSDLKHPNVVNLIGFTLNPFTMIMEYIDCGDLHKFLHSPVGEALNGNWALILKLALDIAKGMDFLHSVTPPLLHRDLKSPNILLAMKNGHYQAKVGDFGLSSRMFIQSLKHKLRNFPVGNITWVAPEILREEEYTVKSDVYAFGLILHELLTRKHPYKEFNYQMVSLLEEAIKNGLRPTIPLNYVQSEMGHEYCALMRDCWDNDVERRPTFTKIVKRLRQIISRDDTNNLQSPGSPLSMLALSGTNGSFDKAKLAGEAGLTNSMSPAKGSNLLDGSSGNLSNLIHNSTEEIALGGQLQMNIRAPMECNIGSLVWENRRVWGGCDNGSFIIWNAENGTKILQEYNIHPGPIHNLLLVDDENVWSSGGVGTKNSSIRVWNAWRLNMDDQPRFKNDYIKKKGRGTSTFSRKWTERWFVLDKKTKSLNYYHKPTDKAPRSSFSMENASIDTSVAATGPLKLLLNITTPEKRVLELEFKNENEKNQWQQAILRSINQNIPIHEIRLGSIVPESETDYISQLLLVQNDQVWVSFKQNPLILVYSLKNRNLQEKMDLSEFPCDLKWKGTDKMILHQGFIWLTSDTLVAQVDKKSYQIVNIQSQHQQPILSIASIDSSVWVSSSDSSISIWDGTTGSVSKRIECKLPVTKLLQFSGYVWATSFSNISIYDPQNYILKKQIECKQHTNSIKDLIRVFHQTVWSCCGSNNVCIWS